ncbi:MAG: hypothetical protein JNK15_02940 [Planctomycetes bacterium]|nr:hypothetical protein [Planctomycetota bacterium]
MTEQEAEPERVVAELAQILQQEPRLRAELLRARREFFPAGADGSTAVVPGAADAAERRFHEWFLLERESDVLAGVPRDLPPFDVLAETLPETLVGVFVVQPNVGGAVVARDLQDGSDLELVVPPGTLQAGDMLVGRIYEVGGGRWLPSTALAIFRPGVELAQAFQRDLKRLQLERRLFQVELEHLLLHRHRAAPQTGLQAVAAVVPAAVASPAVPLEHLEADLERVLAAANSDLSAADVSQQLANAARPGPLLGPWLDQLAFDTVVDLDRVRSLMLEIWNAHHVGEPPAAEVDPGTALPGETLGERLVRTLDEGLSQKRDVGEIFAQLERMAGIEPDPEDEDDAALLRPAAANADDDEPADDTRAFDDDEDDADTDPLPPARGEDDAGDGDLGPLVEEYLWERQRSADPAAAPLRLFAELQQNAPLPHRDLEQVTTTDLMRLLLHVYLGSSPPQRANAVRAAFAEVRAFYEWATREQELSLGDVPGGCQGPLLDQLERLQAAGIGLSSQATGRLRPGILEVDEVGKDGFGARDDDGSDHWIAAAPAACAQLRPGDLVLGALAPAATGAAKGRSLAGLVVVLPADARALME